MDMSSAWKKLGLAVILAVIVVALGWLARSNARSFVRTLAAQTRGYLLETTESESSDAKSANQNTSQTPGTSSQQPQVKRLIIINVFVTLLAGVVFGWFFHRIAKDPKSRNSAATAVPADLESEEFTQMVEEKVRLRMAELLSASAKLKEEVGDQSSWQSGLQLRIKQLSCFYGLSKLVERPKNSLEQIFHDTAYLIRNAYHCPDVTCVRITFDGVHYETDNFAKSELSQYAQIKVRGDKAGAIEAYYLKDRDELDGNPFLKEERDLLDAVAERLGRIVELRQAGEKLLLFRDLIDRSNDCIFVIDPKWGRYLDVNDRACESLGYARDELLSMTVKDVEQLIPDDSAWQQHIEELKQKGDIIEDGRHRRKDGTVLLVETSLKHISQGKKDYVIAITRDIAERKRAEEAQAKLIKELKEINHEVEHINQELKDFAHIVSHDLKAPLRGIKTLADWIAADYGDKLDEEGNKQMNLLLVRVSRMHNLIDGVLQYSRVGRVKEEIVQVDLNELVPEVIDMVAPPEHISITIENELPVIKCEKTRIMQVFENLLSNSIKYMDKPKGHIEIRGVEQDGFWRFSVADNGPGIEEKYFERIFRIFQTLAPRDEFESTGIGLTVLKKIVDMYGGKIWVESKVGQGSEFFFTLPKQEKEIVSEKLEANIAC